MAIRGWIVLVGLLGVCPAQASPYSDLVVFGDSLSDVGNTSAATFGIQPGAGYFDGRFSNGRVFTERLASGLGVGPLTRSGAGGDAFAYGGAETDGPGGFAGLFVDSLVEQVDDYVARLGGATIDPAALHVVFIGANDLLGGQTDPATPAGVVRAQLERLVDAGARQLLGVNLPRLGLTPRFNNDPQQAAQIDEATLAFNAALSLGFDQIAAANPEVTTHRLDAQRLFDGVIAAPGSFGFANATAPGIELPGDDLGRAAGYVFWDTIHPTRELHALLGEAALRAVFPLGDYNRDGAATSADYGAWRDAYGVEFDAAAGLTPSLAADGGLDGSVDAADYTLWRDNSSPALVSVPEPSGVALLLWMGVWIAARGRAQV
ncbi:SGNH/GDSL hydrolase family protein [Botrimarina sp.]|uniref:SGNH/GDSL hydrolase family protein n=1 Tax=Botrimarina sp. TaxID=2795802 RepID=UPI0032ED0664